MRSMSRTKMPTWLKLTGGIRPIRPRKVTYRLALPIPFLARRAVDGRCGAVVLRPGDRGTRAAAAYGRLRSGAHAQRRDAGDRPGAPARCRRLAAHAALSSARAEERGAFRRAIVLGLRDRRPPARDRVRDRVHHAGVDRASRCPAARRAAPPP